MKTLEVHRHSYPAGGRPAFEHSHADGGRGHKHPETGPACFTIDKDEWLRTTGLRGGGRKVYTAKPKGLQLPIVELAPWQRTFMVVQTDSGIPPEAADAPGGAAVARMALTFDMAPVVAPREWWACNFCSGEGCLSCGGAKARVTA